MSYVIIDGRNLLWRCASVAQYLSTKHNGAQVQTGGVHGFLNSLLRVFSTHGNGGITTVAWEGDTRNFRRDLFPGYKHREKVDEEGAKFLASLDTQEQQLRKILISCGVYQYTGENVEADDVVGTLARRFEKLGPVVIFSNDSDLRQLVNKNVTVVSPAPRGQESVFDHDAVVKKHGVIPALIPDLKALMGDSSDSIPGLKGIGPKTAVQLINACGDVPSIIKSAQRVEGIDATQEEWPSTPKVCERVVQGADDLRLYLKLTTINTDAKLKVTKGKLDRKALWALLKQYKLKSLVLKLDKLVLLGGT